MLFCNRFCQSPDRQTVSDAFWKSTNAQNDFLFQAYNNFHEVIYNKRVITGRITSDGFFQTAVKSLLKQLSRVHICDFRFRELVNYFLRTMQSVLISTSTYNDVEIC